MCVAITLLLACKNNASESRVNPTDIVFAIPESLSNRAAIQLSEIKIYAKLVGAPTEAIEMSISSGSVVGSIEGVPYGKYKLVVTFYYSDNVGDIEIISLEKAITVSERESSVYFQQSDFFYPDTDVDGYTNLFEIKAATDPRDNQSHAVAARMFVTSESGGGDIARWASANGEEGVAAADRICQAAAQSSNLEGDFVAWISDYKSDAYCRLLGLEGFKNNDCGGLSQDRRAGPWVRLDGNPFAAELDALVDNNQIYTSPSIDENGWQLDRREILWTGTSVTGEGRRQGDGAKISDCDNWSTIDFSKSGLMGTSSKTVGDWTEDRFESCSSNGHLLCMEQAAKAEVPDAKLKGKTVFVSSTGGSGKIGSWIPENELEGLQAADYVCQVNAKDAKLSNPENYKAWLSVDGEVDAIDRVGSEGPWVRIDGVLIARNKEQLLNSLLNTSISVNEIGHYDWNFVLTGTEAHTGEAAIGDKHCNGWESNGSESHAAIGFSIATDSDWSHVKGYSPSGACAYPDYRLYCFEVD